MKSVFVTATPPTPNGDLHVGHLSGPFLAADVFTRYQRLRGSCVAYMSSSDDHQSYVLTTAERSGREPDRLVRECGRQIQETLRNSNIELDVYSHALGNRQHIAFVQDFIRLLIARELVVVKNHPSPYCDCCGRFLYEALIRGRCPYCEAEAAGHLCEACGCVNDPRDLIDPQCSRCGSEPSIAGCDAMFFPLEPHRALLEDFYGSRLGWRPHLEGFCRGLLERELPEYPVSHPTNWGIPLPVAGFEGHSVNVWLEMYPGHVLTAREWSADKLKEDWPAVVGDSTLVQFLGHDNSFFNAVLHATLSLVLGEEWLVPEYVITNEFYFLESEKFSTSRGHVIWGRDILDKIPADLLRYYLCRSNPEHWQTTFSEADLHATTYDLKAAWTDATERLLAYANGGAPDAQALDGQIAGLIGWAQQALERAYSADGFSLRTAAVVIGDFATAVQEYAVRSKAGSGQGKNLPSNAAALLRALAVLSAPILPSTSEQLWDRLPPAGDLWQGGWDQLQTTSMPRNPITDAHVSIA